MTTTEELATELATLRARGNLTASDQRRHDWLAKELAARVDDEGAQEVRTLREAHMAREAEILGYADEGDTPTWRT